LNLRAGREVRWGIKWLKSYIVENVLGGGENDMVTAVTAKLRKPKHEEDRQQIRF